MQILLLNSDFQPLSFISDKRAIRLLLKCKADIISLWSNVRYYHASGFIELPSILRLRHSIVRRAIKMVFSRNAVFKRDQYMCQYCGSYLVGNKITIDHIVPKSRGGNTTFENCVTACYGCNERKGAKLICEIDMDLLKLPETPKGYLIVSPQKESWHNSWDLFLNKL